MEQQRYKTAFEALEEIELAAAQDMAEWFPDYLYGVIETPLKLPVYTELRLKRQFGEGDAHEQLGLIRDSFIAFDERHQSNLALYFCGYSPDALEALIDEECSLKETLALLNERFPPVKPRLRKTSARAAVRKVVAFADEMQPYLPSALPREEDARGLAWMSEGLCTQTDPEAFFPEKGGSTRSAKRICNSCDVRAECLELALENDERFGIWGGLSERERRKLKKRSQRAS